MRRIVLLCALAVPLAAWLALPLDTRGQTAEELQRRIAGTQAKIGEKRRSERLLTEDITVMSRRITALRTRIATLQERQARLQAAVGRERLKLLDVQRRLRAERARLARLRTRLRTTRRVLARRLLETYKADKPDVLTVVLNSDGFAALLERGEFIRRIADQDRRIIAAVRRAKSDATRSAARLDRLERRQQRATAEQLARRNEVTLVKQQLIDSRTGLERSRRGKSQALRDVRVDRRELERELRSIEREQRSVRAKLARAAAAPEPAGAPAQPVRRGSGQLIWPVNGPISSPFGPRWGRLHAGIDISAPDGTPIRAAADGRVALADWQGGYGNYTCIQHSAALATCYAHQSRLGTSAGASVRQGQVMGYVGNTGNSFGAHLHLEVRVNGTPVDPAAYL